MPRGMLWGVAFQKWLSRSASTGISGGGRKGERQTQKSTFLGGSVPAKWISGPWFRGLWTMPEARAFTFGGTEGSMLGRRGWFDAVTKRFDAGKKWMV